MNDAVDRHGPAADRLPEAMREQVESLTDVPDHELGGLLMAAMRGIAKQVVRAACIVCVMDMRGVAIVDVPLNTLRYLRKIADGAMDADMFALFGVRRGRTVEALAKLPVVEQRRLAKDEPVAVVERDPNGWTHRLLAPSKMTDDELEQVAGPKGLRSEKEQIQLLERRRERAQNPAPKARYKIDRRTGVVTVKPPYQLTPEDIREIARRLS